MWYSLGICSKYQEDSPPSTAAENWYFNSLAGKLTTFFRSIPPEVFLVKCVLKICSKFTGDHPCRCVISIKLHLHVAFIFLPYCYEGRGWASDVTTGWRSKNSFWKQFLLWAVEVIITFCDKCLASCWNNAK